MILDHLGLNVSDFFRAQEFFIQALEPLGIVVVKRGEGWAMMGRDGRPQFWFGAMGPVPTSIHIAFVARSRDEVRRFHVAAMAAGAKDHGAPGLRVHYHANYFGAFVIGPDGHNIEAVFHGEG
jgi:catechol 2,3-dioxygenase-like lactoylglutathione lyase family enzyme